MMPHQSDVRWHASVPSTMDVAAALAADGAAHGVVVAAEEQTAGRGRRGSTWSSPPGAGLYFSLIARPSAFAKASASATATADRSADKQVPTPKSQAPTLSLLTLAAGVGVREGIAAASGLSADLKWPNDVMVGRRKLAGILAEGLAIGTSHQAIVIGVGVNVQPAAYPPDVAARATSIEGELGRAVNRDALFAAILDALWHRLATLEESPGDILQAWRAASPSAIGTRIEWEGRAGLTNGIDDTGALLVQTTAGVERIIAGELRWNL
jgi:BirA family biotin operon repressor/biotin-[acetyl-CoA-carboxylase] ligase